MIIYGDQIILGTRNKIITFIQLETEIIYYTIIYKPDDDFKGQLDTILLTTHGYI